jgi:hypothetical protein
MKMAHCSGSGPTSEPEIEHTGESVSDDVVGLSEPDDSEPDDSEPDDSEPDDSEPDDSEPDDSEPDDSVDELDSVLEPSTSSAPPASSLGQAVRRHRGARRARPRCSAKRMVMS